VTDWYVIGVDPGSSTGVFVLRNFWLGPFARWQEPHTEALTRLTSLLGQLQYTQPPTTTFVIAAERFIGAGSHGPRTHQPVAQRVCGQLEALAAELSVELVWQSPADAKRFAPNERLRSLGLYTSRGEVNQPDANDVNDAARHALLLLARRFAAHFEDLLNAQH
jgi:hypothetical protein